MLSNKMHISNNLEMIDANSDNISAISNKIIGIMNSIEMQSLAMFSEK